MGKSKPKIEQVIKIHCHGRNVDNYERVKPVLYRAGF